MDQKEVKAYLKAAREHIRNKKFEDAAQQCKIVLKVDRDNYNALVFLGVASEGLEQCEQALKAYRKAIERQPDQILAWQGISGMLDKKADLVSPDESIEVYEKLAALHVNDVPKQIPQFHKLLDLYVKTEQKTKVLDMTKQILDVEKEEEQRVKPLCSLVSLLLPDVLKLSHKDLSLYESALQELVQSSVEAEQGTDFYARLLLHHISRFKLDDLPSLCTQLQRDNPSLPSVLEYNLRLFLDKNIGEGYPDKSTCDSIKETAEALNSLQLSNPLVKVGQAFLEIQSKNYKVAKDLLSDIPDDLICGHYYLGQAYLYLHSSVNCVEVCKKGLTACAKADKVLCVSSTHVKSLFELAQAEAYYEAGTEDMACKALALLEEVQELMPTEAFLIKAYLYLDQDKVSEAETCASYLPHDALPVQTLKASILYAKKNFDRAYKILQNVVSQDPTDARATLLLGLVLWELKDVDSISNVKQECFATLLKAAKLDPYNFKCFLYIGYFYEHIQKDILKAKRCYQKAFDICSTVDETGVALVDALLALGEEREALKVLQRVTSAAPAGSGKWAWLRLGLHQMRHDDASTAIISLQSALRAGPDDQHVWECLAEAYLQRGSFTAALKAFTKASELCTDSVYCLYQIASIKHTLGLTSEAVEEYKIVLNKSSAYVPALKGMSESLLQLAKQHVNHCLIGCAQDKLEEAIVYLTKAVSQRPDMSCLWNIMGEACSLSHHFASNSFRVPTKLTGKHVDVKEEMSTVTRMDMLQIGARCFNQALKSLPESGSLWHDLAVNIYYQSELNFDTDKHTENALPLLDKAVKVMKKSLSIEPKNWNHWNALGVIACSKIYHRPALAQHCFIKSIECDSSNAEAWTNLGSLYLDKGEVKLAHEAFKMAQSADPTYMACWIGQALIAEIVGHEEAMDLFRHTTELGFHVESAFSYGQWVLSVLSDSSKRDSELYRYCIQQMSAVPAASDALCRYTARVTTDAVALNMQGLLFEHQKMFRSSVEAYTNALRVMEESSDQPMRICTVRKNLARVLCKQGRFGESLSQFELCEDEGFHLENLCMYGLALMRSDRLDGSTAAFQKALSKAPDGPLQSQIYCCLGIISYMQGDLSTAKSFLFDGFQTNEPSIGGLLALCSLGLLQRDSTLASAVLDELHKRDNSGSSAVDTSLLEFFKYHIEGNGQEGEKRLREIVTTETNTAMLCSLLASISLRLGNKATTHAVGWAFSSLKQEPNVTQISEINKILSLAQLSSGHHSRVQAEGNALKNAQKAVHSNPGCASALSTLACAVHAEAEITGVSEKRVQLLSVEEKMLGIIISDDTTKCDMLAWSLQQVIINCMMRGDEEKMNTYLIKLKNASPKSTDIQDFLQLVDAILSNQLDETTLRNNGLLGSQNLSLLTNFNILGKLKGLEKAFVFLKSLPDAEESSSVYGRRAVLERVAYIAYKDFTVTSSSEMEKLFDECVQELKTKEIKSPIVSLLQALNTIRTAPDNIRLAKHFFATALDEIDESKELGYCSSILRQNLLDLLWQSKKETDKGMIKGLLEDAASKKDHDTEDHYKKLSL